MDHMMLMMLYMLMFFCRQLNDIQWSCCVGRKCGLVERAAYFFLVFFFFSLSRFCPFLCSFPVNCVVCWFVGWLSADTETTSYRWLIRAGKWFKINMENNWIIYLQIFEAQTEQIAQHRLLSFDHTIPSACRVFHGKFAFGFNMAQNLI